MLSLLDNDQYASSLKVLLEAGREQELLRFLEAFARERTDDIERVCGTFYQVFGDFDELSSLEKDAARAKDELERLAVACAAAEQSIRGSAQAVTQRFSLLHNRDVATQAIDACLALLRAADELEHLVGDRARLAEALFLLERIQTAFVAPLAGRVDVVRHVAAQLLPRAEAALAQQAAGQVKAWMTLAWETCQAVGAGELASAGRSLARQAEIDVATRKYTQKLLSESGTSANSTSGEGENDDDDEEGEELQLFGSSHNKQGDKKSGNNSKTTGTTTTTTTTTIGTKERQTAMRRLAGGFNTLAEAVFVAQRLGTLGAVSEEYNETKALQIPKLFQHSSLSESAGTTSKEGETGTGTTASLERFTGTLETVAGFFAIEADVAQAFEELLSGDQLQDLWRVAAAKCKQALVAEFAQARTRDEFLAVLRTVLEFGATTARHRLDAQPLLACVSNTAAARYCELEFQDLAASLAAAHARNVWEPAQIASAAELQALVVANGLPHDPACTTFPQRVSFSALVPLFFSRLRASLRHFFALAPYLGDIERQATKHADVCLQHFIRLLTTKESGTRSGSSSSNGSGVPPHTMAVQQLADLCALRGSPAFLERYLSQRCVLGHTPHLDVSKTMLDVAVGDALAACEASLGRALDTALDAYAGEWLAVFAGTLRAAAAVPATSVAGVPLHALVATTETLLQRVPRDHAQRLRALLYPRIPAALVGVLAHTKKVRYSALLAFDADILALLDQVRSSSKDGKEGKDDDDGAAATLLRQVHSACQALLHPDEAQVVAFCASKDCPVQLQSHAVLASLFEKMKDDSQAPSHFNSHTRACIKQLSRR